MGTANQQMLGREQKVKFIYIRYWLRLVAFLKMILTILVLYVGCQAVLWQRLDSTKTSGSSQKGSSGENKELRKARMPVGQLDDSWETKSSKVEPTKTTKTDTDGLPEADPYAPFPDNKNPVTGEIGGPRGPEPTRYGDWERKGRISDF